MLEDMVTTVTKHLKRGARIRIGGLGILQVRKRPARMGRNPGDRRGHQDQGQQEGCLPRRQRPEGIGLAGSGAAIFPHAACANRAGLGRAPALCIAPPPGRH